MKDLQIKKNLEIEADLLPEYDFFSKSKPNRFASVLKNQGNYIQLEPDISKVFSNSEEVNKALRAYININKLFLFISILLFAVSCSNPSIYKPERKWIFEVKYSFQEKKDTLTLFTYDEIYNYYQLKCEWLNVQYDLPKVGSKTTTRGTTGIIERHYPAIFSWIYSSQIWMHPPRHRPYVHLNEMVPFPWIEFPIFIGQKNDWKLTPKDGWKELEGKTVTGYIEVTDKIYFDNPVIKDSVWVLDAVGNSEVGRYTGKYYFHEKYGFIYFFYDFNQYQIEIEPIEINF